VNAGVQTSPLAAHPQQGCALLLSAIVARVMVQNSTVSVVQFSKRGGRHSCMCSFNCLADGTAALQAGAAISDVSHQG